MNAWDKLNKFNSQIRVDSSYPRWHRYHHHEITGIQYHSRVHGILNLVSLSAYRGITPLINTRATATLRREQLERKFGFVRQCSICVAAIAESDARRTKSSMLAVDAMAIVHGVESNAPEAMQATDQLLTLHAVGERDITEPLSRVCREERNGCKVEFTVRPRC